MHWLPQALAIIVIGAYSLCFLFIVALAVQHMDALRPVRIWWLKRRARKYYLAYKNQYADMSCGATLGQFIRGGNNSYRDRFNQTMDELARIDPETPKSRLY